MQAGLSMTILSSRMLWVKNKKQKHGTTMTIIATQ